MWWVWDKQNQSFLNPLLSYPASSSGASFFALRSRTKMSTQREWLVTKSKGSWEGGRREEPVSAFFVTGDEKQSTIGRRKKRGALFPPFFYIERETSENEAAVDHSIHRAAGLGCSVQVWDASSVLANSAMQLWVPEGFHYYLIIGLPVAQSKNESRLCRKKTKWRTNPPRRRSVSYSPCSGADFWGEGVPALLPWIFHSAEKRKPKRVFFFFHSLYSL